MSQLTRRMFLGSAAGAAFLRPRLSAQARMNVVLILVDDLGWKDFGCTGSTWYETPNIDALASQGMRFTNAYASCPVCSPTRASLLTGKYPARLNITDWIPGRKQNPASRVLVPAFEQQLPLRELTIAEVLQPLGYNSISIGKWHLGGERFGPEQQGFLKNIGGTELGYPKSYFGPVSFPNLELAEGEE
jgi:arylsulfatase A